MYVRTYVCRSVRIYVCLYVRMHIRVLEVDSSYEGPTYSIIHALAITRL